MVFKLGRAKSFQGGVKDNKLSSAFVMSYNCYFERTTNFLENASTGGRIEFLGIEKPFSKDSPCWQKNFCSPLRFLFPRWGVSYADIIKRGASQKAEETLF